MEDTRSQRRTDPLLATPPLLLLFPAVEEREERREVVERLDTRLSPWTGQPSPTVDNGEGGHYSRD